MSIVFSFDMKCFSTFRCDIIFSLPKFIGYYILFVVVVEILKQLNPEPFNYKIAIFSLDKSGFSC